VLEPITWFSRDTLREEQDKNSTSTKKTRPLDLTIGRTMLWKFNPMEVHLISDSHLE
jgi:hypothetical protein